MRKFGKKEEEVEREYFKLFFVVRKGQFKQELNIIDGKLTPLINFCRIENFISQAKS